MFTLKSVMRANALSCASFAIIFLLYPHSVSNFLGAELGPPTLALIGLGGILLFNGLHLIWASLKASPSALLIGYFCLGDFIWVLATLGLVCFNIWVTTDLGISAALVIALMVGIFGFLQLRLLPEKTNKP